MIESWLPWIADILVVLGLVVMSAAVYGMIWLPDLYTSLHGAGKGVFLGVIPILLALVTLGEAAIIFRIILIVVFLLLTTPVSAHAIGLAAYREKEPMKTPDTLDESGRHS